MKACRLNSFRFEVRLLFIPSPSHHKCNYEALGHIEEATREKASLKSDVHWLKNYYEDPFLVFRVNKLTVGEWFIPRITHRTSEQLRPVFQPSQSETQFPIKDPRLRHIELSFGPSTVRPSVWFLHCSSCGQSPLWKGRAQAYSLGEFSHHITHRAFGISFRLPCRVLTLQNKVFEN